jgi:hypothetical protein
VAEAVQIEAPLEWDTPLDRQALTQFELALPHADGRPRSPSACVFPSPR